MNDNVASFAGVASDMDSGDDNGVLDDNAVEDSTTDTGRLRLCQYRRG